MLVTCLTLAAILGYALSVATVQPLLVSMGEQLNWNSCIDPAGGFSEEELFFQWARAAVWPLTLLLVGLWFVVLAAAWFAVHVVARTFVAISRWPQVLKRRRERHGMPRARVVER